jgi:hypothetical protein
MSFRLPQQARRPWGGPAREERFALAPFCRPGNTQHRVMRSAVATILICCSLGSASAWAIDCQSAPGDPKTGWYSWREIDGRKCWFLKTGPMPPKSALRWPHKPVQETRPQPPSPAARERTEPTTRQSGRPSSSKPVTEPAASKSGGGDDPPKRSAEPAPSDETAEAAPPPPARIAAPPAEPAARREAAAAAPLQFRVVRVRPAAVPSLRLNNGFDLIDNGRLSTMQVFGKPRPKPGDTPADPFAVRFGQAK